MRASAEQYGLTGVFDRQVVRICGIGWMQGDRRLQLLARRSFDGHRREGRCPLRPPQIGYGTLNRARRHDRALLGDEALHHHRIAGGHAREQLVRRLSVGVRQLPHRRSDLTPTVTGSRR
jgi:hypothetical protein